ncbi:set domain protein [Culex quinquefasciatus]|uniref:Set domain protein n=1 Tax=Culex quinquefasciatus TaxID=7176 RepID=B0X3Z2_CULQU|nr:set domain protein [Culex quinquefasciatus]|eukprot:XP_001864364.1 set domain protein [Culex quinquefasciatus]
MQKDDKCLANIYFLSDGIRDQGYFISENLDGVDWDWIHACWGERQSRLPLYHRFKQYGTSLTDKSIRGGPSSASSSVVTAEIMETDTDLLMPVPEESPYFPEKYPGKVCACARSANAASWARAKWTDRGQEQCQIDGGGLAVVLGRRRGILRAQSQNPIINAEYVTVAMVAIRDLLDQERRILLHSTVVCQLVVWRGHWSGHGDAQQPGGGRGAGLKQNVLLLLCCARCPKLFYYPCIAAAGGTTTKRDVDSEVRLDVPVLSGRVGKRGKRKPKLQLQPPPALDKNDGVLAAIESAVAGSNLDNSFDDVKLEPLVTNEQDVVELRNLQKLGIAHSEDSDLAGTTMSRNRLTTTKTSRVCYFGTTRRRCGQLLRSTGFLTLDSCHRDD